MRIADDGDANAETRGDGALGNGVGGVIGALGVDVGAQIFQQGFDVGFGEEHDVVHAAECGNELRAGVLIEDRAAGAFQIAHAGIRVHADDQDVAFAARAFEIADVSDMQRVEAAVGEDDALAAALVFGEFLAQQIARNDFGSGVRMI